MIISVRSQQKSINLNISPLQFKRAFLLKELVEQVTRVNTQRIKILQLTNKK
jgi:hypothetical protein